MSDDKNRLAYRFLTGRDDKAFCERISAALADGYVLYGPPTLAFNGEHMVAGQAVVLPHVIEDYEIELDLEDLDEDGEGEE